VAHLDIHSAVFFVSHVFPKLLGTALLSCKLNLQMCMTRVFGPANGLRAATSIIYPFWLKSTGVSNHWCENLKPPVSEVGAKPVSRKSCISCLGVS
jgi:hypothetical protein